MSTRQDIPKLYKRAIKLALRKGYDIQFAEDFAGWMAVRWLEGRCSKQTLNQSFIDYLRIEFGDLRRSVPTAPLSFRVRVLVTAEELEEIASRYSNPDREAWSGRVPSEASDCNLQSWCVDPRRFLTQKEKQIFEWFYIQDRSNKEYAQTFGAKLDSLYCQKTHLLKKLRKIARGEWRGKNKDSNSSD